MAEVPGTSSETITETVEASTPPPPQQVRLSDDVLDLYENMQYIPTMTTRSVGRHQQHEGPWGPMCSQSSSAVINFPHIQARRCQTLSNSLVFKIIIFNVSPYLIHKRKYPAHKTYIHHIHVNLMSRYWLINGWTFNKNALITELRSYAIMVEGRTCSEHVDVGVMTSSWLCTWVLCDVSHLWRHLWQEGRSLTIRLRKRKTEKKVEWSSDTVDNEHLGRRSSKCTFLSCKRNIKSTVCDLNPEGCGFCHLLWWCVTLAAVFQVVVFMRSRGSLASLPLKARVMTTTKAVAALTASSATAGEVMDKREGGVRRRPQGQAPPTATEG